MNVQFRITRTPAALIRIGAVARGVQATRAMGMAVAALVQRHLIRKNQEGNKRGWPTTNFYGQAAEQTTWVADEAGASVIIAKDGFRQRYFGGKIVAGPGKALAIPLTAEAYGKTPREFSGLRIQRTGPPGHQVAVLCRPLAKILGRAKGRPGGVQPLAAGIELSRQRRKYGEALFLLVKSVTQFGDSTALPTYEEIVAAAKEGLSLLADTQGGTP